MGIDGLWSVMHPFSVPVPLESLRGMTVAVDASIWCHRVTHHTTDRQGRPIPNVHVERFIKRLLKLFHCGVKPLFVFDGPPPALKTAVLRQRALKKAKDQDAVHGAARKLLAVQMAKSVLEKSTNVAQVQNQIQTEPLQHVPPTRHHGEDTEENPQPSRPPKRSRGGHDTVRQSHTEMMKAPKWDGFGRYRDSLREASDPSQFSSRQLQAYLHKVELVEAIRAESELEGNKFRSRVAPESVKAATAHGNTLSNKTMRSVRSEANTFYYFGPRNAVGGGEHANGVPVESSVQEPFHDEEEEVTALSSSCATSLSDTAELTESESEEKQEQEMYVNAQDQEEDDLVRLLLEEQTSSVHSVVHKEESELSGVYPPRIECVLDQKDVAVVVDDDDDDDEFERVSTPPPPPPQPRVMIPPVEPKQEVQLQPSASSLEPITKQSSSNTTTAPTNNTNHATYDPADVNTTSNIYLTLAQRLQDAESDAKLVLSSLHQKTNATVTGSISGSTTNDASNSDNFAEMRSVQGDLKILLESFGIPFVTSPSEADAQCAVLCQLGHVDAVVSDDSDVIVFGSSVVIRDMFSNSKVNPEMYKMKDVEKLVGLRVDDYVCLAMLLGGDYTDGVQGIGPEKALQLLACFDADEGDLTQTVLSRLRKLAAWVRSSSTDDDKTLPKSLIPLRKALQKTLPQHFPSEAVVEAYTKPVVTTDRVVDRVWKLPKWEEVQRFGEE
eukprot:PhF_6_TR27864/c0_g1_i2/m.40746/K10846/ERCC5, XPG, RAD2; DNA excision repair protein ERCC-5